MSKGMLSFWSADHFRISLFSNESWSINSDRIFFEITSSEPNSISERKSVGESISTGAWDSLTLEVKRSLNRVDFLIRPVPDPQQDSPVAVILDIEARFNKFLPLVKRWMLNQSVAVNRIAIGCGALLPATDVEDSYKKLKQFIKVIDIDASRFREMQFQVNLPIPSKSESPMVLNRITSWASIGFQSGTIGNIVDQGPAIASHFAVCNIDVSSDAARKIPISTSVLESLLSEVSSEVLGILDQGIS
ncbi:MAG: hypothetical protein HYX42_02070 [Polaromonas sp.]|uniref:hypothetical protein n=1 Tax=Polaromonas sp. TaxID=1869339 RepID=UPI0025F88D50|nr:hypothetical protein [Polaromonas sp.]MBI2725014.1 hypothetical protein [Polaromonas sp.]